ncbi:alpha/beta-hydrolase [Dendrothele bispora CBS 962.96]|uniref:Alpha/beta-hydrolase n=1 Tax=Dendrothele bispora (strain CBS 962.96) TaxID=1314807 RepID=A0A4V4HHH5_DENBC|nr:alpha/beta-hydrolase [Dendrothele bispora CBS 962.96]
MQTLNVGGLPVHVYITKSDEDQTKPIFILFFLHGRNGSAARLEEYIENIFKIVNEKKLTQELVIVSFDHRNHGHRCTDPKANMGWSKDESKCNPRHAIDMYSIQSGTSRDVSFLIDFLPAHLYPLGQRTIVQWGVAGISLGGHSAWLSLCQEPRVTVGIPIIGCPDYLTLMTARAEKFGISLEGSEYLPDSLLDFIRGNDPASTAYREMDPNRNPFFGKKVLVLSGGNDPLVPWNASEEFVKGLVVGDKGVKKRMVQDGAGHEFTPEMLEEMAKFLVDEILM